MPVNQFGGAQFPFILGAVNDGTVRRNVSQSFLADTAKLGSVQRNAANRIFFFGSYPGPLGGPTGEIGQVATHNYVFIDVAQTFLTQVSGFDQQADIIQYIGFTDRRFVDPPQQFLFSGFADPPSSRVNLTTVVNVSNAFTFNDHDTAAAKRVYPTYDTLGWSQTLLNTPSVGDLFDVFGWVQTLDTTNTDFGGDISHGFIKQHVSFRIQGPKCVEKEYTPFVGESGDDSYPEVSTDPPTLGQWVLRLDYPFADPTTFLTIKNPDFGNADVLRFTKIDRTTRGGDRKIFSDLGWGSTQSFELSISNICETTVTIDELIDFLNLSLGKEIGLIDWENRSWRGVIVNPETDITPQVSGHSVRIVFEGVLVEEVIE